MKEVKENNKEEEKTFEGYDPKEVGAFEAEKLNLLVSIYVKLEEISQKLGKK